MSALGGLLLVTVDGAYALPLAITAITVLALGTGPLFALGTGLVVGSVPPERAGSAASISETGNYFGGPLGFGLLGAAAAAVYRSRVHDTSHSLSGAVAAQPPLPTAEATRLPHDAREAFTLSLHVTGGIAATIFAAATALVLAARRPRPAPRATPLEPDILRTPG